VVPSVVKRKPNPHPQKQKVDIHPREAPKVLRVAQRVAPKRKVDVLMTQITDTNAMLGAAANGLQTKTQQNVVPLME
jgi:hypothetical protein